MPAAMEPHCGGKLPTPTTLPTPGLPLPLPPPPPLARQASASLLLGTLSPDEVLGGVAAPLSAPGKQRTGSGMHAPSAMPAEPPMPPVPGMLAQPPVPAMPPPQPAVSGPGKQRATSGMPAPAMPPRPAGAALSKARITAMLRQVSAEARAGTITPAVKSSLKDRILSGAMDRVPLPSPAPGAGGRRSRPRRRHRPRGPRRKGPREDPAPPSGDEALKPFSLKDSPDLWPSLPPSPASSTTGSVSSYHRFGARRTLGSFFTKALTRAQDAVRVTLDKATAKGRLCVHDRAVFQDALEGAVTIADVKAVQACLERCASEDVHRLPTRRGGMRDVALCRCGAGIVGAASTDGYRYSGVMRHDASHPDPPRLLPPPALPVPKAGCGRPMAADEDLSSPLMVVKLRSHYTVRLAIGEDIRMHDALIAGNRTFKEPLFIRTWFAPTARSKKLKDLRRGLGTSTLRMISEPNAGGSSINSEAISLEMMQAVFGAELWKLETEVKYDMEGSIADYIVECFDRRVGVSVTRAMKYHGGPSMFTREDARSLLTKKLLGLQSATACVAPEHRWGLNILHIWSETDGVADTLHDVLRGLDRRLWERTIILSTVTNKLHNLIFKNFSFDHDEDAPPAPSAREVAREARSAARQAKLDAKVAAKQQRKEARALRALAAFGDKPP